MGGSVSAKYSRRRGLPPPSIFTRIDTPYNSVADGFRTNKLRSRLSLKDVHFLTENGHLSFLSPLCGIEATYTMFILGSLKRA